MLLLGEAGIGKTTTAREAARRPRRDHVTVRWSACWSGGATVAHAPWLTLLSGLGPAGRACGALARPAAITTPAPPPPPRRGPRRTPVVAALEEATAERPALLVLDDLHWADEGTLQLLDVVAAHLPGLPVLVVGTYRATEVAAGSPLTRLGAAPTG